MIFQYGTSSKQIDITERVFLSCRKTFVIYIPACDDARAKIFGDPIFGTVKSIWIDGVAYGTTPIFIDTVSNQIYTDSIPDYIEHIYPDEVTLARVLAIQKTLVLRHGSFRDELPEQKMAVRFLQPGDTVLELGGNVGRNSLIIGSIVKSLVVLECDEEIAKQLEENRDANGMRFAIEAAALSLRPLIQKGWNTIVSEEVLPGYTKVNTITLDEIRAKYTYDTLVLDCEGAFYYILQDMPDVVYGVHTIIMENDYRDPTHKEYIDRILTEKGFSRVYREALGAEYAWMKFPCADSFFEVWRR
jgi:FkbM family methyltransferase